MTDTLSAHATHALEVKHSRFIVHAAPVASPAEALAFVAEAGDPAATHNCWAYRIGSQYRFSDDGEPAGTAGRPILAAIDGQGYDQVVAVVTRWYGGIKLGAGGLVRAYGGATAECLRIAPRQALVVHGEVTISYPFEVTGAVHATLAQAGAEKLEEEFLAEGVRLRLRIPADHVGALKTQLRDATRDRVRFAPLSATPTPPDVP